MIDANAFRKNVDVLWKECFFEHGPDKEPSPWLHVNSRNASLSDDALDNMDDTAISQMVSDGWNMEFEVSVSGYFAIRSIDKETLSSANIPADRKDEIHYFVNWCLSYLSSYAKHEVEQGISEKDAYDAAILEAAKNHNFYNLLPFDKELAMFASLMNSNAAQREKGYDCFLNRWREESESDDLCLSRGFAMEQVGDGEDIVVYRTWHVDGDYMSIKQKLGTVSEDVFNQPELFKKMIVDKPQIPDECPRRSWAFSLESVSLCLD